MSAVRAAVRTSPTDTRATSAPLGIPAVYLARRTASEKRQIAAGHALYLRTLTESDPRLATLSEPVSADDLNHALWVLRSLFGAESRTLEGVTLYGGMAFASLLLRLADEAENARRPAPLPLPAYALAAEELDARDLPNELEWATHTGRAASSGKPVHTPVRKRATKSNAKRAKTTTPVAAVETDTAATPMARTQAQAQASIPASAQTGGRADAKATPSNSAKASAHKGKTHNTVPATTKGKSGGRRPRASAQARSHAQSG